MLFQWNRKLFEYFCVLKTGCASSENKNVIVGENSQPKRFYLNEFKIEPLILQQFIRKTTIAGNGIE